jgi:hypothetical protein
LLIVNLSTVSGTESGIQAVTAEQANTFWRASFSEALEPSIFLNRLLTVQGLQSLRKWLR